MASYPTPNHKSNITQQGSNQRVEINNNYKIIIGFYGLILEKLVTKPIKRLPQIVTCVIIALVAFSYFSNATTTPIGHSRVIETAPESNQNLEFDAAIYHSEEEHVGKTSLLANGRNYRVRIEVKNPTDFEVKKVKLNPVQLPYWIVPVTAEVLVCDSRSGNDCRTYSNLNLTTQEGLNIGKLTPGESVSISFEVKVYSEQHSSLGEEWEASINSSLGEQIDKNYTGVYW